jgi:hypothetical protein
MSMTQFNLLTLAPPQVAHNVGHSTLLQCLVIGTRSKLQAPMRPLRVRSSPEYEPVLRSKV